MVAYNLLELAVSLVDLALVRPLGPAATAAFGVGRQVTFVVEAVIVAVSTGIITLVSQAVGARSTEQVDDIVRQGARLVLLLGVPVSLAGFFLARPLLAAMQVDEKAVALGEP